MFRKKSLLRTEEALLRRTNRRKKNMGKMSDIIRRELLSESDDDDDSEDAMHTPKRSKSSQPVETLSSKRNTTSNLPAIPQKINIEIDGSRSKKSRSGTKASHRSDFTLSTDTDDDCKSFDLPSTLPSLPSPGHMATESILGDSPTLHSANGSLPEQNDTLKESQDSHLTSNSIQDNSLESQSPLDSLESQSPLDTLESQSPLDTYHLELHQDAQDLPTSTTQDERQGEGRRKKRNKVISKLRTEYYRQYYRPAWEKVPEFKGWLSCVEGVPSKAQCVYCSVELTAHSVSLMKHVSSAKHQRNAEKMYIMNSDLYVPEKTFIKYNNKKIDCEPPAPHTVDATECNSAASNMDHILPSSKPSLRSSDMKTSPNYKSKDSTDPLRPDNAPFQSKSTTRPTILSTVSTSSRPSILSTTAKPTIISTTSKPTILSTTSRPTILSNSSRPTILSNSSRPTILSATSRPTISSTTFRPTILSRPQSQSSLLESQQIVDQEDIDALFDKVQIIMDGDEVDKEDVVSFSDIKEQIVTLHGGKKHETLKDIVTLNGKDLTNLNDKEHNVVTLNDKRYNTLTVDEKEHSIVKLNDKKYNIVTLNEMDIVTFNEKEQVDKINNQNEELSIHLNERNEAFSSKEHIVTLNDKGQIVTMNDEEHVVTLNYLDEAFSSDEEKYDLVQVVKVPKDPSPDKFLPVRSYQPISTHVIDSHVGRPISNLEITLYKLVNGSWRYVSEIVTNAGGRASDFISDTYKFQTGRYKLHYHVYKYWQMKKLNSIFPFIEIPFDVCSISDHLHFPLILSANGFNVYKGCAA